MDEFNLSYQSPAGQEWTIATFEMAKALKSVFSKSDAIGYAQMAFEIAQRNLGEGHDETIKSITNLSYCYYANKKYGTALLYAEKAILVAEKYFGEGSLRWAGAVDFKIYILGAMEDIEEAINLANTVLEIYTKSYGKDHEDTKRIQQALADFYNYSANKGKPYWKRALNHLMRNF